MNELTRFGWNDFFAKQFTAKDGIAAARVTAEHRNRYRVRTAHGEQSAQISGKLRHRAVDREQLPAVGDWVEVTALPASPQGDTTIHRILPRKSKFSRKAAGEQTVEQVVAANVDSVWIVSSLDRDFSLRRIERYLTLAWESGASPVVVLTKSDLSDDADRFVNAVESVSIGTPVHSTSSLTRDGTAELAVYFRNHATVALLGSSGVGKSTLINTLAGSQLQQIAEVRSDGKGRHTTTHRQLIHLPGGGLIIDTPGMRELQLWDGQTGLSETFGDIDEMASGCRFSDCQHEGEPGCAVVDAVAEGRLSQDRLESYQKLQRELAYLERKQDVHAQLREKQRTKAMMKSVKQYHPKYRK